MISTVIINYALLTHQYPHYPVQVIYFETKELCESALSELKIIAKPICLKGRNEGTKE